MNGVGVHFQLPPLEQDADAATDAMLFRDNQTWSKGRLKRAKVMSLITGKKQPSRKKIFFDFHVSEDLQVWSIEVQGKSIRCAKVYNPEILTKSGSNAWTMLTGVQRLEIEDPEATQNSIPKQLVIQLRNLESLSITWTKIKSLPSALFQLPLNSLYLQRNHIKTINGIEKASQLTILDISNNRLDGLPKTFGQLQSLVTLNLSGNRLHDLPDSVGSLSQLKALDCSCNKLRSLPASLGNLIELTSLDLSTNQLTSLPESVGSLPKLEDLRLRSNQLASLPDMFSELHRLNSLLLRNNRFEDVPVQLSRLTNLQSLNMRENMIRHMDRPINPLKYLILDENHLRQIDVGILQCPNLQYLSLKSNDIVEVTGSIGKLASIRSLNLSDNAISDIPEELERLGHLRHLSLCCTKIRTVPLGVACMPGLKTLEIDQCTELECYLNIAYKNGGLPGVIEHLKKESASADPPCATVKLRPKSLFPVDDGEDGPVSREPSTNRAVRDKAGLSIVPGTSVSPPASEAMLQVEVGRNAPLQLVHVARQSLCPSDERPAKPRKPAGLADRRPQQKTAGAEPASVSSPTRPPATGIDDATVITTIPHFGDLTSSSSTETTHKRPRRQDSGQATASSDAAAQFEKRDQQNPRATGNASRAPRGRGTKLQPPPVKKKPPKNIAT